MGVAIYATCEFVAIAPRLFDASPLSSVLGGIPFIVAAMLVVAAVFIAAMSINHPVALLVPFFGLIFSALLTYYIQFSAGDVDREFAPIVDSELHAALWQRLKYGAIPLVIAALLGLLAADRMVESTEGTAARVRLPDSRRTVLWTVAALSLNALLIVVVLHFIYGGFVVSQLFSVLAVPGAIAIVIAPVILYRAAAVAFSLIPIASAYYFSLSTGACVFEPYSSNGEPCWPSFQPDTLSRELLVYGLIFAMAMFAGWWARRPEQQPAATEPQPQSSGAA